MKLALSDRNLRANQTRRHHKWYLNLPEWHLKAQKPEADWSDSSEIRSRTNELETNNPNGDKPKNNKETCPGKTCLLVFYWSFHSWIE